jgi:photosystem II stability/assembly factor-like uncharacterized protein
VVKDELRRAVCLSVLLATVVSAQSPVLTVQSSGVSSLFQAVSPSATEPDVVWISGHAGTWARTTDGGRTWTAQVVPGRESLQFRDVHAIDARRAWLMAAGNGEKSGIFQTSDSGRTWTAVFVNRDSAAFYDCMAFFDDTHGFAFSDAVDARIPVMTTSNGRDWSLASLPGIAGEGGFAASGTCALTLPGGRGWIGTGSGATPRVLRTTDRGGSWMAAPVPLVSGSGAGITGLAFLDARTGVAVGGTIGGTATGPRAARTRDGGATWQVISDPAITGPAYGVAVGKVGERHILIAVGPGGAAWSANEGDSWTVLDSAPYWSVGFSTTGVAWMVGPKGRVVRVDWH